MGLSAQQFSKVANYYELIVTGKLRCRKLSTSSRSGKEFQMETQYQFTDFPPSFVQVYIYMDFCDF